MVVQACDSSIQEDQKFKASLSSLLSSRPALATELRPWGVCVCKRGRKYEWEWAHVLLLLWEKVSLCSPDWPGISCVDQGEDLLKAKTKRRLKMVVFFKKLFLFYVYECFAHVFYIHVFILLMCLVPGEARRRHLIPQKWLKASLRVLEIKHRSWVCSRMPWVGAASPIFSLQMEIVYVS